MGTRSGAADYRCGLCGERIFDTAPHHCLVKDLRQGKSEEELRSREPEDIVINQVLTEKHIKQIAEILGIEPDRKCTELRFGPPCAKGIACSECEHLKVVYPELTLGDLLRCVWAINRKRNWTITPDCLSVFVNELIRDGKPLTNLDIENDRSEDFIYKNHNNNEQQALTAALIYVLDRMG